MAADSLYSSYRRYKADTDAVATWLLTTAKAHGWRLHDTGDSGAAPGLHDTADSGAAPATGPRLKGRARKLARDAKKAAEPKSLTPSVKTYCIAIKDFVPLAEFIAAVDKPRVKVPDAIVWVLREAIRARKSHLILHDRAAKDKNTGVDGSHAYFIRTLEMVLDVLCPGYPEPLPEGSIRGPTDSSVDPLANVFSSLTLEEPEEISDVEEGMQPAGNKAKITAVVDDDGTSKAQEALMASRFLACDFQRIRTLLRSIWTRYHQGQTDLISASLTTNTAIDFCRQLQEDWDTTFPGENKEHEDFCVYCAFLCAKHLESGGASSVPDMPCMMTSRRILAEYIAHTCDDGPFVEPMVSPMMMELYGRPSVAGESSVKGRFRLDFSLAWGVLPELHALVKQTQRVQAEHGMIGAVRQLVSRMEAPFWVTFAVQVFLDIRHVLREDVVRGFEDMCRGGRTIQSSINQVLRSHCEVKMHWYSHPTDRTLGEVLQLVGRWIDGDAVRDLIDRRERLLDPGDAAHIEEHYLLRRDPLLCGMLLYNFQIVAQEGALITANAWKMILGAMHLYNGLRQTQISTKRWERMESIISMHGSDHLFIGALPTTAEACSKRIVLAFGMSPELYARDHRMKNSKFSESRVRLLKSLEHFVPILWTFKGRICDSSGRPAMGPSDITEVLAKHSSTGEGGQNSRSRSRRDNVCTILAQFHEAVQHEARRLSFDHFRMHVKCWQLLRRLRDGMEGLLSASDDGAFMDERALSSVALDVLFEAAKTAMVVDVLGISGPAAISPVALRAAEIIEDEIQSAPHSLE